MVTRTVPAGGGQGVVAKAGLWLLVGLLAAPLVAADPASPPPERFLELARAAGLRVDAVEAIKLVPGGSPPVDEWASWVVQVRRGEFRWQLRFRTETLALTGLTGPPLLRNGLARRLTTPAEAAAEAEAWLTTFGFPLADSEWVQVAQRVPASEWRLERALVRAPETVTACGGLEVNPATGALLQFAGCGRLRLPEPLPPPVIPRAAALARALALLQRGDLDLWTRLVSEPQVLRVRRVFFVRGDDRPSVLRSRWEVDVAGQGLAPLSDGPAAHYWRVWVQEWDGAVVVPASEATNHRFVLGREMEW